MSKVCTPSITGALFDCDGTLLDSLGRWRSVEHMLADRAGVELTPEESRAFVTYTIPEVARHFHWVHGLGADEAAVVTMIDDYMMSYYTEQAELLPGVRELLDSAVACGVRLAVTSSSAHIYLEEGLRRCGVRELFTAVYSVDDVGASKREPVIYDRARADLGTDRATTWGLDDSVYAVETLRRAGYPTVGIYEGSVGSEQDAMEAAGTVAVPCLDGIIVRDGALVLP